MPVLALNHLLHIPCHEDLIRAFSTVPSNNLSDYVNKALTYFGSKLSHRMCHCVFYSEKFETVLRNSKETE